MCTNPVLWNFSVQNCFADSPLDRSSCLTLPVAGTLRTIDINNSDSSALLTVSNCSLLWVLSVSFPYTFSLPVHEVTSYNTTQYPGEASGHVIMVAHASMEIPHNHRPPQHPRTSFRVIPAARWSAYLRVKPSLKLGNGWFSGGIGISTGTLIVCGES